MNMTGSEEDDGDYDPSEVLASTSHAVTQVQTGAPLPTTTCTPAACHADDDAEEDDYAPVLPSSLTTQGACSHAVQAHPIKFSSATASPSPLRSASLAINNPSTSMSFTPSPQEQNKDAEVFRLQTGKSRVRCLALLPNGTVLCAGCDDGQLCMWDFDSAPSASSSSARQIQPTRVLTPFVNRITGLQPIVALHASRNGGYFVVCPDADCAAVVQSNGKQGGVCARGERGMVDVVRCKGHCAPLTSSSAHGSDDNRFYTAAQDGTARLWDVLHLEQRSTYVVRHGSGQIDDTVVVESVLGLSSCVGVGGHGGLFLTGGADGCVQLWDTRIKYRPGGACSTWNVYAKCDTDCVHHPASQSSACTKTPRTSMPPSLTISEDGGDDDDHANSSSNTHRGAMSSTSTRNMCRSTTTRSSISATAAATVVSSAVDGRSTHRKASMHARWEDGLGEGAFATHERHVGGMVELPCGEGLPNTTSTSSGGATATMMVAVRTGDKVAIWDFRQTHGSANAISTSARAMRTSSANCLRLHEPLPLPVAQDTSSLVALWPCAAATPIFSSTRGKADGLASHAPLACPGRHAKNDSKSNCRSVGFFACTGQSGYRHTVGGHVVRVEMTPPPSPNSLSVLSSSSISSGLCSNPLGGCALVCTSACPVGRSSESVMCLAQDTSRPDGCLYAGLDSGAVAVLGLHARAGRRRGGIRAWVDEYAAAAAEDAHPVERWLARLSERESAPNSNSDDGNMATRKLGNKAARSCEPWAMQHHRGGGLVEEDEDALF